MPLADVQMGTTASENGTHTPCPNNAIPGLILKEDLHTATLYKFKVNICTYCTFLYVLCLTKKKSDV